MESYSSSSEFEDSFHIPVLIVLKSRVSVSIPSVTWFQILPDLHSALEVIINLY